MNADNIGPNTCGEDPNGVLCGQAVVGGECPEHGPVGPEQETHLERKPIEPMWEAMDCPLVDDDFYNFD